MQAQVWLEELHVWLSAVDWEAVAAWPWWGTVGVGLGGVAVGAAVGWRSARKARVDLGAEEVLTALERVVRQDYGGALRVLESATVTVDAPPELYLAMASLLRSMGHAERSAQLHRALTQRPDLDKVLATRAVIGLAGDFLTLGRSQEAEELLGQLPRKIRRQDALLALRRNAAIRAGDWKEALSAGGLLAKRTNDNGDGVSEIYGRMASAALARGDDSQAVRDFKRALSASKANVHASEGLARIYVSQQKFSRARSLLERALEHNGDIAPRLLPLLRASSPNRQRYQRYLEKLAERGAASPWVELEQAELAYEAEDFDEAADILTELSQRFPRSLDVREAYLNLLIAIADERTIFAEVDRFVAVVKDELTRFRCRSCGYTAPHTFVACPRCDAQGSVQYV